MEDFFRLDTKAKERVDPMKLEMKNEFMPNLRFSCVFVLIKNETLVFVSKGKFRIRDVSSEMINVEETRPERRRKSMNPITFHHHHASLSKKSSTNSTNDQIHQFDLNRNPIALKCRLYIIKALLFRAWDRSGKADPYIKIFLNNDLIIDDVKSRLYNTLEPIFGK